MKKITVLCAVTFILITASVPGADFSSWTNAMSFRFTGYTPPGGTTTLSNFPALVVLSTNLPGFRYTDFTGTNSDLRFTDSTATNELNYQVEQWDTNGSSYVWVQVPRLTDSNTQICAFWGKSGQTIPIYTTNGATWTENFKGVWHLNETVVDEANGGTHFDSTSNHLNGVQYGNSRTNAMVAGGQDFFTNAPADYVTLPVIWTPTRFSLSFWLKPRSLSNWNQGIGIGWGQFNCHTEVGGALYVGVGGDSTGRFEPPDTAGAYAVGAWSYITFTYDNGTAAVYKGGTLLASKTGMTAPAAWTGLNLTPTLDGVVDEVELSSVARSSNWVWASWMTMASNSAFVTNSTLMKAPRPVNTVTAGVTSDQFDVSQGAKVFSFSTTWTNAVPLVSDPRDILGLARSTLEGAGRTLFADGSVGQNNTLSFRTASHISLTNYQLRVSADSASVSTRAINNFRLYGSADNMTYTLIDSNSVGVPYDTIPGVTSGNIMISGMVNTPAYQFFKLEVNHGSTNGPRVMELDGFGPPAFYSGTVLDPIVFNSTLNAASTNTYRDQDPGYATNIASSALNTGENARQALGASGGINDAALLFTDTGIVPDNGNLTFGDGETVHWISWDTTQSLRLAGVNLDISYDDRPTRLVRFSVNGILQVFKNSSTTVYNVTGINGKTNLLFASPVNGNSFKLELTGGTNSNGTAYGPRLYEIDALLSYEPQGTIYTLR